MEQYFYKEIKTPVGKLKLVATLKGLSAILWENDDPRRVKLPPLTPDNGNKYIEKAHKQLEEYFSGHRKSFDIEIDATGTPFQKEVWDVLLKIPYGETRSYGEVANLIKRPKACRAVGAANGKNPLSIIAACHRVIGATGSLTGFAGGLERKKFLLNLERADL